MAAKKAAKPKPEVLRLQKLLKATFDRRSSAMLKAAIVKLEKERKKKDPKKTDPKEGDPKKTDSKKVDPKEADPKKADPKRPAAVKMMRTAKIFMEGKQWAS